MATLGDLVVKMSLDMAGFERDAGRAAHQAEQSMTKIAASARMAAAAAGAAVAVIGAALFKVGEKLIDMSTKVAAEVDAMQESAEAAGVATQDYESLARAFQLAGVQSTQFDALLKKLNVSIVEAADGTGKQAEAFKRLGVSVTTANGQLKSADQVVRELSEAFQKLPAGPERAALAIELLGKEGARAIPALVSDLEALEAQAVELGAVTSAALERASEQYERSAAKWQLLKEGIAKGIATEILPAWNQFLDTLVEFFKAMSGIEERAKLFQQMGDIMSTALKNIAYYGAFAVDVLASLRDIGSSVADVINLNFIAINRLLRAIGDVATGDFKAAAARIEELERAFEQTMQRLDERMTRPQLRFQVEAAWDKAGFKNSVDGMLTSIEKFGKTAVEKARPIEVKVNAKAAAKGKAAPAHGMPGWEVAELEAANKASEQFVRKQAELAGDLTEARRRELEKQEKDAADAFARQDKILEDFERDAERSAERINNVFAFALSDSLVDLAGGTKSVSDAFASMAQSIVGSMQRIAADNIARSLFGGSDVGGFFSGLFGGAFASGGMFQANRMILVGERGPEMIHTGNTVGRVAPIPAGPDQRSYTVTNHINVPASTDRRTAQQIAASVGVAVGRAMQRNE